MDEEVGKNYGPPDESVIHKAVSAVSALFAIGSTASGDPSLGVTSLSIGLILPLLAGRQRKWLETLDARFRLMESYPKEYPNPEELVSIIIETSQMAMRNHQEEKHHALLNALEFGVKNPGIAFDEKIAMIRLIDTLTPTHMLFLKYWYNPHGWCDNWNSQNIVAKKGKKVFTHTLRLMRFLEIESQRHEPAMDTTIQLRFLADLINENLLKSRLTAHNVQNDTPLEIIEMTEFELSDFGKRLVQFIMNCDRPMTSPAHKQPNQKA